MAKGNRKTFRGPKNGLNLPYHGMDRQIWDLSRKEGETISDISVKLNIPEKYVRGMVQLFEDRGH